MNKNLSRKKEFVFIAAALLAVLFLLQSCQKKTEDNFILITLDTQRADFISSYSRSNASTPNIDSLAENGILYENCHSLIPITLPSHASIFFSQPPHMATVYNNGEIIRKKRKRPSFVNVFKKNGYTTGAFVSLGVLKSKFGLEEGFDLYDDSFIKGRWYSTAEEINRKLFPWLEKNKDNKFFLWVHYSDPHHPYAPPDTPPDLSLYLNDQLVGEYSLNKYEKKEVTLNIVKRRNLLRFEVNNEFPKRPDGFQARFDMFEFSPEPDQKYLKISMKRGWLIQREKSNFLSKKDPHITISSRTTPIQIKLTFRGSLILSRSGIRELYKREVEYLDGEIGKLIEKLVKLNVLKKTHILMVGDHGEGLGEYKSHLGGWHVGHIHFLYDVYTRVPLIIYNPRSSQKGLRIKEFVTPLDIAPTIMEIMGFKKLSSFQGRNLLSLEKGKNIAILEETFKPEAVRDKFALLQYPWHLITTPEKREYELFNLEKDPEEKENIYRKDNLPEQVLKLKQKLDTLVLKILKEKKEVKIDKKSEEMLRALGYIK